MALNITCWNTCIHGHRQTETWQRRDRPRSMEPLTADLGKEASQNKGRYKTFILRDRKWRTTRGVSCPKRVVLGGGYPYPGTGQGKGYRRTRGMGRGWRRQEVLLSWSWLGGSLVWSRHLGTETEYPQKGPGTSEQLPFLNCGWTNKSENIIFPRTSYAGGKNSTSSLSKQVNLCTLK